MSINLNLNSFRAMVGSSINGEVRLTADGNGLEKINNHFLQNYMHIKRTQVSPEESHVIRRAFMSSLSGLVDASTLQAIRLRLGIDAGSGKNGHGEIFDKPLSRRDIRDILEMADKSAASRMLLNDDSIALHFRDITVSGLRWTVDKYNASADSGERGLRATDKLQISDDQLNIALKRHRLDMQIAVKNAAAQGKNVNEAICELLKKCLATGDGLNPGKSALSRGVDARGLVGGVDRQNFGNGVSLFQTLGIKPSTVATCDAFKVGLSDTKAFRGLTFGKGDFDPINLMTFSNVSTDKIKLFNDLCNGNFEKAFADLPKEAQDIVRKEIITTGMKNLTRNALTFQVGNNAADSSVQYNAGDETIVDGQKLDATSAAELNSAKFDKFVDQLLKLKPKITVGEVLGVGKAFNQIMYNAIKNIGWSPADYNAKLQVSHRGTGDVRVTFNWTKRPENSNTDAPQKLYMAYAVKENGMAHVQGLGDENTITEKNASTEANAQV